MEFGRAAQAEIEKLYRKRKHVDLSIGIWQDGEKRFLHLGPDALPQEGGKDAGEPDGIYPVGSICKPFTASFAAKYIAEGKLYLHAPISEYLEGLPDRYYPSLEKLFTHTSGFKTQPYTLLTSLPFFLMLNREGGLFHTNPFRGKPTEEEMMAIIRDTVLEDRDYPFVYSNIGMSIAGYIAGKVSGEGFWDGLNRWIREDLGLAHTFLGNVPMTGYDKKDQPCHCWQWEKGDIIAPAGALNSTVGDLLDFAALNLDGSLPYLSMCHEVHGPCEKNADSGLAWRLEKDMPISWHTGTAGAFSAFLGMNREKKAAVAVAVNYGLVNAEQIGFAILRNDLA